MSSSGDGTSTMSSSTKCENTACPGTAWSSFHGLKCFNKACMVSEESKEDSEESVGRNSVWVSFRIRAWSFPAPEGKIFRIKSARSLSKVGSYYRP